MASTTRVPSTTLTPSVTAPISSTSSSAFQRQTPSSPRAAPSHPQLAQIANATLSATQHTHPAKIALSSPFQAPLFTGAAAMADNIRHEKESEKRRIGAGYMTSPNPARTALMGLQGPLMSRPGDAPARPIVDTSTNSSLVAEPAEMDNPRPTTPTVQSPLDMNASEHETPNVTPSNPRKRPASSRSEERSMKAMTYPPPLGAEDDSPRTHRNLSFSGHQSASKSPLSSSKKHKCPHCSTEFTRHHNLKSHLLTHSQEKPYGCQSCSARFRRLHDLKRHIKLHTGERAHACNKCGRRFARGDALARHNKGPGGCAGRRGSGGDGDDYNEDGDLDQSMEGTSYHSSIGHETGGGDEHQTEEHRQKSEAERSRNDAIFSVPGNVGGTYRQHSSTYPGIAPASRGFYPPAPPMQNPGVSPRQHSKHLSPNPPHSSALHGASSIYAQSEITESPKPLSPRLPEVHRANTGNNIASQHQQQQSEARGSTGSHLQSMTSQPTATLPPVDVLAGEVRYPPLPLTTQNASIYPTQQPSTSSSAVSGGSGSSHGQSSGSSMRDILRHGVQSQQPSPAQQQQDGMWEYMRSMERRLEEQVAVKLKNQESHYEAEISRLKEQITTLTSQQQRPILPAP